MRDPQCGASNGRVGRTGHWSYDQYGVDKLDVALPVWIAKAIYSLGGTGTVARGVMERRSGVHGKTTEQLLVG